MRTQLVNNLWEEFNNCLQTCNILCAFTRSYGEHLIKGRFLRPATNCPTKSVRSKQGKILFVIHAAKLVCCLWSIQCSFKILLFVIILFSSIKVTTWSHRGRLLQTYKSGRYDTITKVILYVLFTKWVAVLYQCIKTRVLRTSIFVHW